MSRQAFETAMLWYVIHTNHKQEDRAESNLRAWEVETFFPRLQKLFYSDITGVISYIIEPLFPGYIFARFSVKELYQKVRYTRGVKNVVCYGQAPISVEDGLIDLIQSRRGENGFIRIKDDLKVGDKVEILQGPLKSFTGILERKMSSSDRVMILLNTIAYQGHIVVDQQAIKKVEKVMNALVN